MIEQALAALIASGLPGIFCVVFLFAIGYLYRSKAVSYTHLTLPTTPYV